MTCCIDEENNDAASIFFLFWHVNVSLTSRPLQASLNISFYLRNFLVFHKYHEKRTKYIQKHHLLVRDGHIMYNSFMMWIIKHEMKFSKVMNPYKS